MNWLDKKWVTNVLLRKSLLTFRKTRYIIFASHKIRQWATQSNNHTRKKFQRLTWDPNAWRVLLQLHLLQQSTFFPARERIFGIRRCLGVVCCSYSVQWTKSQVSPKFEAQSTGVKNGYAPSQKLPFWNPHILLSMWRLFGHESESRLLIGVWDKHKNSGMEQKGLTLNRNFRVKYRCHLFTGVVAMSLK